MIRKTSNPKRTTSSDTRRTSSNVRSTSAGRVTTSTSRVGGRPSKIADEKLQQVQQSIVRQQQRLMGQNMDYPKDKNKASILERALAPLTILDPRRYAMAKTEDYPLGEVIKNDFQRIWKTTIKGEKMEYEHPLEEKVDTAAFSDVLEEWGWEAKDTKEKVTRAAVGLGLDIVADPKTWLTFGAGKLAKVDVPGKGIKSLSKPGMQWLDEAINQFGFEQGHKMMGSFLKRQSDDVVEGLTKEPALRFMGKDILPKSWIKKPIQAADSFLEQIPFGGKVYKASKAFANKTKKAVMAPFDDFRNLRGKLDDDDIKFLKDLRNGTKKLSRAKTRRGLQKIYRKAGNILENKDNATVVKKLTDAIEGGNSPTGDKMLDEFVSWVGDKHTKMWKKVMKESSEITDDAFRMGKVGAQKTLPGMGGVEGYMRHYLTDDAADFMENNSKSVKQVIETFGGTIQRSKKGFMKTRNLDEKVSILNDMIRKNTDFDGDFFEENVFKILAKEEDEYQKALMSIDYHKNIMRRLGKSFGDLDDIAKKKLSKDGIVSIDGVDYVAPKINIFGKKVKTNKLLPKPLVNHIKKTNAVIGQDEAVNKFFKYYDKALGQFKKHVTGIFPAFHMRNLMGATFNNFLAGVKPGQYVADTQKIVKYLKGGDEAAGIADDIIELGQHKLKVSRVAEMAQNQGVFNQPGMMDVMRDVDDMIKQLDSTTKGGIQKAYHKLEDLPRRGFETVENQVRLPLFMDRLAKGNSPKQAAKSVFKYHFDYAPEALNRFEKKGLKRIIPFYTWTKNNIPLQLEQIIKQPGKYAAFEKLQKEMDAVSGTKKVNLEREKMPEWMRQMYTLRMPTVKESGEPYYLQLDLPFTDINKLSIKEITSMMSPLLKYPIERVMNKNLFFDSKIYNKDLPREKQWSETVEVMKNLPKPVKDFLGIHEVKKKNYFTEEYEDAVVMDSKKLHALRSMFTSRYLSTIRDITEDDTTFAEKITKAGLGEPLRPLNIDEAEWSQKKNYEGQLRTLITHYLKHKQIPYSGKEEDFVKGTKIPKESIWSKIGKHTPGF